MLSSMGISLQNSKLVDWVSSVINDLFSEINGVKDEEFMSIKMMGDKRIQNQSS